MALDPIRFVLQHTCHDIQGSPRHLSGAGGVLARKEKAWLLGRQGTLAPAAHPTTLTQHPPGIRAFLLAELQIGEGDGGVSSLADMGSGPEVMAPRCPPFLK